MANPFVSTDPQLSELEALQLQASRVTDASLDSTRNMVNMCEEASSAGIRTLGMLDEQGEQLDRVEGNLDGIHAEMKEAEKHLHGMEKWCGLCVCPWSRPTKVKIDGSWENPLSKNKKDNSPVQSQPGGARSVPDASNGPYIQRLTNDAREDAMEENMQAVGSYLGNMKDMAREMGTVIEKQNNQLGRIQDKAEKSNVQVKSANTRTENMLK